LVVSNICCDSWVLEFMVSNITILVVSNICSDSWVLEFVVSNITILVVSNICCDSWVLEFMVSNITCNNKWENCISLDFDFRGFSGPRNQQKLDPHNNDFTVIGLNCR
jgi:hypothetical protein